MYKSTMTSKGQITIPKEMRDHLGLREGSVVMFDVKDERGVLMTKATTTLEELGNRIFYQDSEGNCFECYKDKTRKSVDKKWLFEQKGNNRQHDFKGSILLEDDQIGFIRRALNDPFQIHVIHDDAVKFHHSYGLISDEEFVLYHENKKRFS